MEFSQEFLLDMAINAAGFLAAGLIGMVFYALFSKKSRPVKQTKKVKEEIIQEINTNKSQAKHTASTVQREHVSNVKFIKLGSQEQPVERQSGEIKEKSTARTSRKEIIQLARKMLEAGSTTENIKRILPVSDAELALLSLNNK